jgi:hypothetical protein
VTTIVWDGRSLVADRQLTTSGCRFQTTKAHRLPDGSLFASCGAVEPAAIVLRWLREGGEKPTLDKDSDFEGVLVKPDKTVWVLYKQLEPVPIESPCYATGSGRDFALAALQMGKTAKEAVLLACELDIWSGMGITELRL